MSEEKRKENQETVSETNASQDKSQELSPTWAQDALSDLEDWIEEQGIYLRQ